VVLAALGFLVFRGLGNATVYFKTADEAVRDRSSLGTHRFRVEGTVVGGTIKQDGAQGVDFTIENKGVEVPVRHTGNEPELFQNGIPVVLEGHWAGTTFASDRIMVKHSETYRKANPDRVKDYPKDK
jgi:cytochrome c-type biogenesis protein CcmE